MATTAAAPNGEVSTRGLRGVVTELFLRGGLSQRAAAALAHALVEADQQDAASHGVAMVPMYVERLELGSVTPLEKAVVVEDRDAVAVLDAQHMFGHLAAEQAMALAVEKAIRFGLGAVAVRHAFHFGVAGRYAAQAAREGCIGVAMSNTKPMMAPPGGLRPLVGNNPIAIAAPSESGAPILIDMALSEVALAKVRMAASRGEALPPGWAVGADGLPTTDPQAALAGMLSPIGGGKGFALALMIDVMCGLLSGGAWGDRVKPLFGDLSQPNDCAFLFFALDVSHFRPLRDFLTDAEAVRARVAQAPTRSGLAGHAPGDRRTAALARDAERVVLEQATLEQFLKFCAARGVDASPIF